MDHERLLIVILGIGILDSILTLVGIIAFLHARKECSKTLTEVKNGR